MRDLVSAPLEELLAEARRLRPSAVVTYSPKVFVPLTTLCRDVCGYCTFARPPRRGERAYMTEEEVLEIARAGAAAGCREALFTLGDKPELRYKVARDELRALGCGSTLDYLARCARLVLDETGLLPHLNPGVMSHTGSVRNLSLKGCCVDSKIRPFTGMQLTVHLHVPGEPQPIVIANAAVRWSETSGIGLEFLTVDPPHRDRLDRLIQQLQPKTGPQ